MKTPLGLFIDAIKSPVGLIILLFAIFCGGFFVLSSIDKIENFFGFNTKENLEKRLDQAEHNVDTLTSANAGNQKAAKIAEAAKDTGEKAAVAKQKNDTKVTHVADKIKVDKEKKIAEIEKSQATPEEKADQVSFEQITSIWKTYCSFNKDETCPADMPYTPIELPEDSEGEIQ